MRVVKAAQERRKEILDVAEKLFITKGYDNTSTNDILAEIGIARGTLYYHFKSKEDILDGIIFRVLEEISRKVKLVTEDKSLTVLERFTKAIVSTNVDNELGRLITELVHKPQNALMNQKMRSGMLDMMIPYIKQIICDGVEEGIMKTDYPEEVVEMTLSYAYDAFDDEVDYPEDVKKRKILGFIENCELMLNMKKGSLLEAMIPMFYRE